MTASVNIVVAMKSEALPLIDRFGLERVSRKGDRFLIYGNDQFSLTVSGIGAKNSEEAVRYLSKQSTSTDVNAWLNIGVAGHRSYDIGTSFLANCIVDSVTNRTLFPVFAIDFGLPTGKVTTVNVVETEYQEHTGYDMEAFGFAASASKFSTLEMIHCFKVVSDNRENSVQRLTKKDVEKFIDNHVESIDLLCSQLRNLASSVVQRLEPEDPTVEFAKNWRMTVTQRRILRKYLHKTKILNRDIKVTSDMIRDCRSTSVMLEYIRSYLDQHWKIL